MVVSAGKCLSTSVDVEVRRDGKRYDIGFANGDKVRDLSEVGSCLKEHWVRPYVSSPSQYFDSANISVVRLRHLLRVKAVFVQV